MKTLAFALFLTAVLCSAGAAQEGTFDVSKLPDAADRVEQFVPKGWKLEATIKGDLNGDGTADYAIKLVEDKPVVKDEPGPDRNRVLVLALAVGGKLRRAAVADKLLQCTTCGGAFYGVLEAPADVKIEKGVLIIDQESGSRDVTETTYRFRYDQQPSMFILIGFDYTDRDRATGGTWNESTNYLTGKRVTTIGKKGKTTTKTSIVQKMRYSISEINDKDLPAETTHRLGLD